MKVFSRTLAKLRARALIDVQRNQIVILDRQALEGVASGLSVAPAFTHRPLVPMNNGKAHRASILRRKTATEDR